MGYLGIYEYVVIQLINLVRVKNTSTVLYLVRVFYPQQTQPLLRSPSRLKSEEPTKPIGLTEPLRASGALTSNRPFM